MGTKKSTPEEMIQSAHDSISRVNQKISTKDIQDFDLYYALAFNFLDLAWKYMRYRQDALLYRDYTKQAWVIYVKLLHEKDVPEYLLEKLHWEVNYKKIMQFLSAGLIDESIGYARILWDASLKLKKFDHPFMELMAKTFFPLLLEEHKEIFSEWIEKFYERCNKPRGEKYFIGFVKMMDGIFKKNGKLIEEGLQDVIKFKGSIKRSDFDYVGNNIYSYWGIGLANLAISRGVGFRMPDDPYLPKELLMLNENCKPD